MRLKELNKVIEKLREAKKITKVKFPQLDDALKSLKKERIELIKAENFGWNVKDHTMQIPLFHIETPPEKEPLERKISRILMDEILSSYGESPQSEATELAIFNSLRNVLKELTALGLVKDEHYYEDGRFLNNEELSQMYKEEVEKNRNYREKIESLERIIKIYR